MAKPASSRCVIEIDLERPERAYKPGERIKGTVEILPGMDMKCRKVTLIARWAARGRGPEDAADYETILFPGGAWRNNEKVSHAFDFAAPAGPLSYEGELFNIRWYLTATADLPARKDTSATVKFELAHGQPDASGPWFDIGSIYNPFAALGPPSYRPVSARFTTPAAYTALNWLSGLFTLGVLALIILYFIGLSELGRLSAVGSDLVWSIVILGAVHTAGAILRGQWRQRRREALNRLAMRNVESGAPPRRLPGKYWRKSPPDDSQRGWARSVSSLGFVALGVLLMAVGGLNFYRQPRGPEAAVFLTAAVAGLIMAAAARGSIRPSWRFIRTAMALGRVEHALSPERPRCGDELRFSLDFRPSLPVALEEATATFETYEVVEDYFKSVPALDVDTLTARAEAWRTQNKKHRNARVARVYSQKATLASGRTLLPQESANLSGRFAVPRGAPPTFLSVGNRILWFLTVRIKLANGIEWTRDIPVDLQP
jgi:hypothetical protein